MFPRRVGRVAAASVWERVLRCAVTVLPLGVYGSFDVAHADTRVQQRVDVRGHVDGHLSQDASREIYRFCRLPPPETLERGHE